MREPGCSGEGVYVLELAGDHDALAILEARSAATQPEVLAPGLALCEEIAQSRIQSLAFTHRVNETLAHGTGGLDAARAALQSRQPAPDGTVAVRARNVRGTAEIDTQAVERQLGGVLVDAGCEIDLDQPTHELRACFAAETWVLGWLVAESVRDYGARQPTDRPFFHPGAMDPLLARAVANIAIGSRNPMQTLVLDPMCGTGGILTEAGLVGASVLGGDVDPQMVVGARRNLAEVLPGTQYDILRGDAGHLPVADDAVDAVVFDAPYGRQSKIAGTDGESLVFGALSEAKRVASHAVVVTDQPLEPLPDDVGWTVENHIQRPVHRSLTRYVHVLQ